MFSSSWILSKRITLSCLLLVLFARVIDRSQILFRNSIFQHLVIRATCRPTTTTTTQIWEEKIRLKEIMRSTNLTSYRTWRQHLALEWKSRSSTVKTLHYGRQSMQDVLIVRCKNKEIQHNNKPTSMKTDEWRSLDEIARSTIWMHLAENVYFNMAKRDVDIQASGCLRK